MVNNQKDNSDPKANMALLKQQYGKEAEFISKEGFPFNAFDDEWVLNGLGNNGQKFNISWVSDTELSKKEQNIMRLSFAGMTKRNAKVTLDNIAQVKAIKHLKSLSVQEFKSIWPSLDDNGKTRFKSLIIGLHAHDMQYFNDLYVWMNTLPNNKQSRDIFDIEKGYLSQIENQSFNVAMNQRSSELIERGFDIHHSHNNSGLGNLIRFRTFVAARLVQTILRRPSNLIQLKWLDISPDASTFIDNSEVMFSDDDELKVRMFKAKQTGSFRQYPEGIPLVLNNAISREVIFYRKGYMKLFNAILNNQGINLSTDEFYSIFMKLPVFFVDMLFKTKFNNKRNLFKAASENGSGFHMDNKTLQAAISGLFNQTLKVSSDRLSPDKFRINNNRIRHTAATTAGIDNVHVNKIAQMLGNTPHSAKIYVDLSDESRALIDKKFIANEFLINAFTTSISTLVKSGEVTIEDDFGGLFGKSKKVNQCIGCNRSKPIGCYGCNNFSALADGDHLSQKEKAQQKYDYRIKCGDSPSSLIELKKQIRFIEITISACDQILQSQNNLRESI